MTKDFALQFLLEEYQHILAFLSTATHMVPLFFIHTALMIQDSRAHSTAESCCSNLGYLWYTGGI